MINWREIELSDKDKINEMICASGCHGADYSFANLYIWRNAYKPKIAFNNTRLLVFVPTADIYAYPKGDGDVSSSIEALLEDAHSKGNKLLLRGLTDKTLDEFLPLYGDRFEIEEDRDNADYIYTKEKLSDLSGRRLSSKRNHIHKFEKNGDWKFVPIENADDITAARDFLGIFYEEKNDPSLASESVAIDEMFKNYSTLGFIGGLLYQNGVPVAFTAATKLDDYVVDVHFEKALPGVEGAYTMINREFARYASTRFPEITHFNREEDMGLEGLRRAKQSYHPDILLMKYFAKEK